MSAPNLFSRLVDAFCSFSYTTSVKESYSHPYDHVTEEPCSDPRTSYRCTHHRWYHPDDSLPVHNFLTSYCHKWTMTPNVTDGVNLSGSAIRRPTGRRWGRSTAGGTSAARATTRVQISVSVSPNITVCLFGSLKINNVNKARDDPELREHTQTATVDWSFKNTNQETAFSSNWVTLKRAFMFNMFKYDTLSLACCLRVMSVFIYLQNLNKWRSKQEVSL